jgi:hypothetical protein
MDSSSRSADSSKSSPGFHAHWDFDGYDEADGTAPKIQKYWMGLLPRKLQARFKALGKKTTTSKKRRAIYEAESTLYQWAAEVCPDTARYIVIATLTRVVVFMVIMFMVMAPAVVWILKHVIMDSSVNEAALASSIDFESTKVSKDARLKKPPSVAGYIGMWAKKMVVENPLEVFARFAAALKTSWNNVAVIGLIYAVSLWKVTGSFFHVFIVFVLSVFLMSTFIVMVPTPTKAVARWGYFTSFFIIAFMVSGPVMRWLYRSILKDFLIHVMSCRDGNTGRILMSARDADEFTQQANLLLEELGYKSVDGRSLAEKALKRKKAPLMLRRLFDSSENIQQVEVDRGSITDQLKDSGIQTLFRGYFDGLSGVMMSILHRVTLGKKLKKGDWLTPSPPKSR